MTVADLVTKVQLYDPSLDGPWLEHVYEVADHAHEGQRRASGEPYVAHPLAVADTGSRYDHRNAPFQGGVRLSTRR